MEKPLHPGKPLAVLVLAIIAAGRIPCLARCQVPADLAVLTKKAEAGDVQAQFLLGRIYVAGNRVARDDRVALRWFRKAADQGYAEAQNWLGLMYLMGRGVQQDLAEATRWFRRAADQGLAEAQFLLGVVYAEGRGVPQDFAEAARWFRQEPLCSDRRHDRLDFQEAAARLDSPGWCGTCGGSYTAQFITATGDPVQNRTAPTQGLNHSAPGRLVVFSGGSR